MGALINKIKALKEDLVEIIEGNIHKFRLYIPTLLKYEDAVFISGKDEKGILIYPITGILHVDIVEKDRKTKKFKLTPIIISNYLPNSNDSELRKLFNIAERFLKDFSSDTNPSRIMRYNLPYKFITKLTFNINNERYTTL